MSILSNIWTAIGFGASKRIPGVQILQPASGKLTNRSVTPDTALQISAVFACVRLLSETIAGLPLNFYRKEKDSARREYADHPLYKLLSTKPNRYQTRVEFWETIVMQLALHGNAYARIDRSSSGEIFSLMPLMSLQVEPILGLDGNITYRYNNGRDMAIYAEQSIWHIKLFGNGIIGLSPLDYARNSIGIAISADDRVNNMANNGFKPSGILMIDKLLTPEQRKVIKENFADLTEGGEDALRVLEAGMTYQQVSMNPKDVQLLESRKFQTEDIARFFGVPSVLINDTTASTVWGSGISEIIRGFHKLNLRPYLERIECSIVNRLLPIDERRYVIPEFDFDMLLRGDEKTRYESYQTAIRNGIKTINECRLLEGLSKMDGGDQLLIQQQLVTLDSIASGGKKNEQKKIAANQSV